MTALCMADADQFATRCMDREAIERVYHDHRIGIKQTFEQTMPRDRIEQIIRLEIRKEAVLRDFYHVEITPEMIAAELRRIDATTHSPDILAEVKHAAADDPVRFAEAVVRPNIVERELRSRFENDAALHAPQRNAVEEAREKMKANLPVASMQEMTWYLTPRPSNDVAPAPSTSPPPTQAKAKSPMYSNDATAQFAQVFASPEHTVAGQGRLYFHEMDLELQNVLRVQLKKPGDVSAVIEMSGGFLVFALKELTTETITTASFSVPKRSFEVWLAAQPETKP